MPGLFTFISNNTDLVNSYRNSSGIVEHGFPLSKNILLDTKDAYSFVMSHSCYAYTTVECEGVSAVLVGKIYNLSQSEIYEVIANLAGLFMEGLRDSLEIKLSEFVNKADGDFVLQIYKNANEFLILTDFLGRLPIYYRDAVNFTVFGTEIKSLFLKQESVEVSRLGLCEFLLYEYNIGDSTLYKDVFKIRGGSVLYFDGERVSVTSLVDGKLKYISDDPLFVPELVKILKKSTSDRCGAYSDNNVDVRCDISGGLDSRLVACLLANHSNITYQTFQYTSDESLVAREVLTAIHGKSGFSHIRATHDLNSQNNDVDNEALRHCVWLGDGLVNYSSCLICHNDLIASYNSNGRPYVRYTGLGASDFIRKYPYPLVPIHNMVNGRSHKYGIHSNIDAVFEFTKVAEIELKEKWISYLHAYTKDVGSNESLRYLYLDFQKNYVLLSAEERERMYCWTVPIMYSSVVIKYVFNHFDPSKAGYYRFRKLLLGINKDMLDIPLHGRRIAIKRNIETLAYDIANHLRHLFAKYFNVKSFNNSLNDEIPDRLSRDEVFDNLGLDPGNLGELTSLQLKRLETLLIFFRSMRERLGVRFILVE